MLSRAVTWVFLLTGANAIVCVLVWELGYGAMTFLFGPTDRFADLVKVGLSYKALVSPHLTDAALASWPEIFREYYQDSFYVETLQPGILQITNLHLPPLGQLLSMSAGLLTVTVGPVPTLVAAFLVYLAALAGAVGGALPPRDRTPAVLSGAALLFLFSYPALFLLTRGNLHSALTTAGIVAFCLALHRRESVPTWSLLALAVAVNLRPNAGLVALALPLLLGLRASLPHLVKLAVFTAVIFVATLGVANLLNPEFGLGSFLAALRVYAKLYVEGPSGDAFNSSLLALLKALTRGRVPFGIVMGVANTLAIALLALTWAAARTGRLGGAVVAFLVTACYALCTPTFGDYHLLVFVAPLLLIHLEAGPDPLRLDQAAAAVASVLLLSAKNLGSTGGHSFQVFLNPLVTAAAVLIIAQRALRPAAPAASVEA